MGEGRIRDKSLKEELIFLESLDSPTPFHSSLCILFIGPIKGSCLCRD